MPKKLTKYKFIQKSKKVHNNLYNYDLVNYINSITKVKIICNIHGMFEQTPSMHMQGNGCKKCSFKKISKKLSLTTQQFIKKANIVHYNKYNYTLVNYKHSKENIIIICKIHGKFNQTPSKHLSGRGCAKCAIIKNNVLKNKKIFIQKANIIHNNLYDYSKVEYINSQTKVKIICKKHGEFLQKPNSHLNGNRCYKCFGTKKKTNVEFILEANKIHKNKYNYDNIFYKNNFSKIEIICSQHGSFFQTPKNHLNNHGCPKCAGNYNLNINEFITKANKIHNCIYNYSRVNYISHMKKIEIICQEHGSFFQKPNNHLNGQGCLECSGSKKMDKMAFIKKAKQNNDSFNNYDYSKIEINGNKSKIEIICNQHGSFFQTPNMHLFNHGCPKCTNMFSKKEIRWLDDLKIKKENRQISLPGLSKKIKVDGYDPETNTVYEFLGSYYHGDPIKYNLNDYNKKCKKTFRQLYFNTIKREIKIRKAGYNYQFIWESDFKNE